MKVRMCTDGDLHDYVSCIKGTTVILLFKSLFYLMGF
jgi:hypothetical protein